MDLWHFLGQALGDIGALFNRKEPASPEFTPRAQQVFALAKYEAVRRHHDCIGIPHFLFAVVNSGKNAGSELLRRLGANPAEIASELDSQFGLGRSQSEALPYSRNLKKCLALGAREATTLNHRFVGTDHLLLGMVRLGEEPAPGFFRRHQLDLNRMRQDLGQQSNRQLQDTE